MSRKRRIIGTLNESHLHANLKKEYLDYGDKLEHSIEGFVIDIVKKNELVEIQTGNFGSLKRKLKKLLENHKIRIIFPIPAKKWLIKLPKEKDGEIKRRKSPKEENYLKLFDEFIRIPQLLTHENLTIEAVLIHEEEIRFFNPSRNWRRRGWEVQERKLLKIIDKKIFQSQQDYLAILPEALPNEFTTKDISKAFKIRIKIAQKIAYSLRKMKLIEKIGKRKQAYLYKIMNF